MYLSSLHGTKTCHNSYLISVFLLNQCNNNIDKNLLNITGT
jgi:hypothetical protein